MIIHSVAPLLDTEASTYRVGQVWEYSTRPNELGSLLTVVKVELQHETAVVVHVHIEGLNLRAADPNGFPGTTASHLPFSEKALDDSVTHLVDRVASLPDYEEGYMLWREAFLEGKAGMFDLTVAEVLNFIESTISN
jgi:hypothetical protein